jgi:AbrB family looped-hinge helix DNA binding protein
MTLIDMRTVTVTDKGQIVIPKNLREGKGFKEGSKLVIMAYEDHIVIRPIKLAEKIIHPATDSSKKLARDAALLSEKVLSKTWLSKEEDEAWKNL